MSSTAVSHHGKQCWNCLLDFQHQETKQLRQREREREREREGGAGGGQTIRFIIVYYIRNQNNLHKKDYKKYSSISPSWYDLCGWQKGRYQLFISNRLLSSIVRFHWFLQDLYRHLAGTEWRHTCSPWTLTPVSVSQKVTWSWSACSTWTFQAPTALVNDPTSRYRQTQKH